MSLTAEIFFISMSLAFFLAVILAPVYAFLIERRVGLYMRQRVRRSAATMPAVERQGGAPLRLANEAAPHTPLGEAGRTLRPHAKRPPERGGDALSRRSRRGVRAHRR